MWELYLEHRSKDGTSKNPFLIPITLRYTKLINSPNPFNFVVNQRSLLQDIDINDLIIIYIRNKDLGLLEYTRDFVGIVREKTIYLDDNNIEFLEVVGYDPKVLLSFRTIAYFSGTSNKTTFSSVPAETLMKSLVADNMTSLATLANGRWRNGDMSPSGFNIYIESDSGNGPNISASIFGNNVLDALQKISNAGGGDFDLEYIDNDNYIFKYYENGIGEDKTSGTQEVVFSLNNSNISNVSFTFKPSIATVGFLAGEGEKSDRTLEVVSGGDYSSDNDIEIFIDSRSNEDGDLQDRGLMKLYELRKVNDLVFDIVQTSQYFYSPTQISGKKAYNIGDKVVVNFGEITNLRITKVTVTFKHSNSNSSLNVDITTENY